MFRKIFFASLLIVSPFIFYAQKYVEKADNSFDASEYSTAVTLYKSAYNKITDDAAMKARIAYRIGYCYRRLCKSDHAELWLAKAVELHYQDPVTILYYADALRMNLKFEDALKQYNAFKDLVKDDPRADEGLRSCNLSMKWTSHPTRYKVVNCVFLNTEFSDYAPMMKNDQGTQMIFSSSRLGVLGDRIHGATNQPFADLFTASKDAQGEWSTPQPLDAPINTEDEEGACSFNREKDIMLFTRCNYSTKKPSTCKIYLSTQEGDTWSNPDYFKVSKAKHDTFLVAHPTITPDGLRLYFVSDLETGKGGYDIWYVERATKEDEWGDMQNAGDAINTKGNEMYPYVRADGTLYFASDGHHGMGGLDLFRVNKDAKGRDQIVNLMYPINSPSDDFGITFENGEERGFFSSNRKGSVGWDDIYQFSLPPLQFSVSGTVFDERTNQPLAGSRVRLVGNDGTSLETEADAKGGYSFTLKPSTNYIIMASQKGYLNGKSKVTTDGIEEDRSFKVDVYLATINIPVEIPNVMYDVGKWELRPESIVALEKLVEIMNDNPQIAIEISSHTDYRQGAITNAVLSQNRAQAVVDFLIVKGIDSRRLSAKGYGDSQPKTVEKRHTYQYPFLQEGMTLSRSNIDKLPPEQREIAHQLNRRTELRVLSTSFQK